MINATPKNILSIAKSLIARIVDRSDDPRFIDVYADGFVKFHMNRDDIGSKIASLRYALDDLERDLENDRQLYGGSNITSKAAELDAALNDYAGKAKALVELGAMLAEKPELE